MFVTFVLLFFCISGLFAIVFNSVSASKIVADSWNTKTPMNQTRYNLGVVTVDGKIYAIGGYTTEYATDENNFGAILVDVKERYEPLTRPVKQSTPDNMPNTILVGVNECYDPVSDTWITLSPIPTPKAGFAIATYQSLIYCIGGENHANTVEVYDTTTNSWSTKASIPSNTTNECHLHASVVDNKIFVIDEGDLRLFMYDPKTDVWAEKTRVLAKDVAWGNSIVLVTMDDKLLVIGEFYSGSTYSYERKVMVYDPKTDVWSELQSTVIDTLHDAAGAATTGCYVPQRVYFLGDAGNYVYDPVGNAWSTIKDLPINRKCFSVAVVDDTLYVIGGYAMHIASDGFGSIGIARSISLNEQYIPFDHSTATSIFSLNNVVIFALILSVGFVCIITFFYYRQRKKSHVI